MDAAIDVVVTCNLDADPLPQTGPCDGFGRQGCQQLARENYVIGIGYGVCTGLVCARADSCEGARLTNDLSRCRCGTGPACMPGTVCAALAPGEPPTCRCIVR